ncbi:MAG: DMT family transporter [Bacteroidetes bacterium]|jgi:drug/metabolite transporter (DMT)-like permease|nr:DMT family transporter [Bacteroidota bacterium]MCC7514478.1 DMT family transporter [Bacteroidia bacterium]MCW5920093.1 DMT family transporter [Bacteroidota bacterium]HCI57357.1 hypothetical protein [Bacteroidota bacterium]HMX96961.1 DMT family transporter [Bacteroidia bacterium]
MTVTVFMAVLFASLLFVILKLFARYKISNIHALTYNYFTAGICYTLYSKQTFSSIAGFVASYFPYYLLSGCLFIGVFYLTALSSQKNGVASTTIASKMSLVIPALLAVYLYNETFSLLKTIGLLMALSAVYLSARGSNPESSESGWKLPLLVFAGAGLVDASIKYTQHVFTDNAGSSGFLSLVFFSAAIIGSFVLLFKKNKSIGGNKFSNIIAGIILGFFNFISLYYMIAALQEFHEDSGKAFIIINSGVVLLNFLLSVILFQEKKNTQSRVGVTLAVAAIIILSQ